MPPRHTLHTVVLGRSTAFANVIIVVFFSRQRPSLSDIQKLAGEGRLHTKPRRTASSCSPRSLRSRPSRLTRSAGWGARLVYKRLAFSYLRMLLRMRPWVMQACRSTASCHLGATRTLRILERSCWWTGMSIRTRRWWLRNFLTCQA